ncbi:MAG: OmpA family protein [Myxococcota bacterium]
MKRCFAAVYMLLSAPAFAQSKSYRDSRGKEVVFPLGDRSFADEVVGFIKGKPSATEKDSDPREILGPPDYDKKKALHYATLGCGGALTLRFTDNALVDVEGPDLYVFEVGPAVEPTLLAISADGEKWIEVGKVSGGTAVVDISPAVKEGDAFSYVRLTDAKRDCGGRWPGADLDAVGAIGSALTLSLESAVLFDFDRDTLRPEAKDELDRVSKTIAEYPGAKVVVEGHTDGKGEAAYNQKLSERRAAAVREKLVATGIANVSARGFGASRPVAKNDTEAGREKNRRVEVLVLPAR